MKLLLIVLLFSTQAFAHNFINIADDDIFFIEDQLSNKLTSEQLIASSALSNEITQNIFKDNLNIISNDFDIPLYFRDSSKFWFSVYAEYSSSQVILHDKLNLGLRYTVLDFSFLKKSNLNRFTKSNIQTKITHEKVKNIKRQINKLKNIKSFSKVKKSELFKILILNKVVLSSNHKKRQNQLTLLYQNIRAQTGQRNKVYQGIINFLPYENFFKHYFDLFQLPQELLGIPFLESSFNTTAHSKVGALGIWQIMPFIARKLLPYNEHIDGRMSPFLSTIASLHLLKQNKRILKRWDLSVTAYNSGTKHLLIAKKKLKVKLRNLSLKKVFTMYNHPHLGFASKNFFPEFLALTRVLAYKNLIFNLSSQNISILNKQYEDISFYLTKSTFVPNKFFKLLKKHKDIRYLNAHFIHPKRKYPKNSLIVSNVKLTSRKYRKVTPYYIKKYFPSKWKRYYRKFK
jgi:membrane-bound lytic murein transglycosylase D